MKNNRNKKLIASLVMAAIAVGCDSGKLEKETRISPGNEELQKDIRELPNIVDSGTGRYRIERGYVLPELESLENCIKNYEFTNGTLRRAPNSELYYPLKGIPKKIGKDPALFY